VGPLNRTPWGFSYFEPEVCGELDYYEVTLRGLLRDPDREPEAIHDRWVRGVLVGDIFLIALKLHLDLGADHLMDTCRKSQERECWSDLELILSSIFCPTFRTPLLAFEATVRCLRRALPPPDLTRLLQ